MSSDASAASSVQNSSSVNAPLLGAPSRTCARSLTAFDGRMEHEKEIFKFVIEKNKGEVERLCRQYGDIGFPPDRSALGEKHPARHSIDANSVDLEGDSLLKVAVKTKDKGIVQSILTLNPRGKSPLIDIEEGLFQAVQDDQMEIVKLLIEFQETETERCKQPSYELTTPLMEAAIHDRFEMIQFFYDEKGMRLPKLHLPNCTCKAEDCNRCGDKHIKRCVESIKRRIHTLKAMASPTYMIFMAGKKLEVEEEDNVKGPRSHYGTTIYDPVYEAIMFSEAINECIELEPEFKKEYEEIQKKAKKLPVDLIGLCRNLEEVKTFICVRGDEERHAAEEYPRLMFAIGKEQTELVSQPNIQFLIQDKFTGVPFPCFYSHSRTAEYTRKIILILLSPVFQIFMFFITCCCCIKKCKKWKLTKYMFSPANRAAMKFGSQLWLCGMLCCMSVDNGRSEKDNQPAGKYVVYGIYAIVSSQFIALGRQFIYNPKAFIKRKFWNVFDIITYMAYLVALLLWFYVYLTEKSSIFLQNRGRFDPLLLAESAYGVANFMSALRLTRWLLLTPFFGPFITAFAHMAQKVLPVVILMIWVLCTFCIPTEIIYNVYEGNKKYDEEKGKFEDQPLDLKEFEALFIQAFGMGTGIGPSRVNIFPYNKTDKDISYEQTSPDFTCKFILLVFNVVVITFLKDSLVGLFGSTGAEVIKNKEVTWKFARINEWLYYIQDSRLAPPFSMIPNGECCCDTCMWGRQMRSSNWEGTRTAGCNKQECCYVITDDKWLENRKFYQSNYPILMRKLFQRYFQQEKWKKSEETKPAKRDKQDVVDKVLEIRQRLGFEKKRNKTTPPQSNQVLNQPSNSNVASVSSSKNSADAPAPRKLSTQSFHGDSVQRIYSAKNRNNV